MRWVFILFLFLNVIYLGWELDRQAKIDRKNNISEIVLPSGLEQLRLVSESDSKPEEYSMEELQKPYAEGLEDTDQIFNFSDNNLVTDLPDISALSLDMGSERKFCYTFGPIEEEILATGVGDWFKSRRAKTRIHYTDERGKQLFWIYLAPDDTNQNAISILDDLKSKGISDYRLINKGKLQNTISLGLFSSQVSVNTKLMELEEKGYKPVIVPYNDGKRVYWVDVMLSVEPSSLETVFNGYPSRYNYVPVDCGKIALTYSN